MYSANAIQNLKNALGARIEAVLRAAPDPQVAMSFVALEAEKQGLIDSEANLRRESPLSFVKDLWLDNPATLDRLALNRDSLPDPLKVRDLPSVLDVLR